MKNNELEKEMSSLVEMLEESEEIKILVRSDENRISLIEYPPKEESDFQIDLRVNINEVKLGWIYLIRQNNGTGTKITSWFIKYCKDKKISSLRITCISEKKKQWLSFVKNMQVNGKMKVSVTI